MGIEIDKILAIDCETSGINWASGNSKCDKSVAEGFQMVSIGIVVSDTSSFKPLAEFYTEIKWNGISKWDEGAEKVHGMSKEYLEENGDDEEDALVDMLEFIIKHVDIKKPLYCLGHNVVSFDIPFLRDLLYRFDVKDIRFGQRNFDSFALSMGTVGEFNSESLFTRVGLPSRKEHNALDDAKYSLETYRRIRMAWNKMTKR